MIEIACPQRSIIEKRINEHLKFKQASISWIGPLLNAEFNAAYFPYKPDTNSLATFDRFVYSSTQQFKKLPEVEQNSKTPKYVVLIPIKTTQNKEKITNILRVLKNESYGINTSESKSWVKANLAAVIALNMPYSIDKDVNKDFLGQIENIKRINGIAYRVFGFFWKFKWKAKDATISQSLYSHEKSYLLLKYLNADIARKIRETLEGQNESLSPKLKKIINMQKIRQRLLSEPYAQEFLNHFSSKAPDSPRYLCSQDADVISIRCQKDRKGLFQHYDDLIQPYLKKMHQFPSFVSTGYKAPTYEKEVICLAINIDMAIRAAMTCFIPGYFPEPNFIWFVKKGFSVSNFSFIGRRNKDRSLESLRLMSNALNKKLACSNNAIFGQCGAVTTEIPSRMKTQKSKKVKFDVTAKPVLQALRSNKAQLHSFPRVWANQIYPFLGLKPKNITDVTTQLMEIYAVFHPITLIFAWQGQLKGRYNAKFFNKVIDFYPDYVRCILDILNEPTKRKEKIQNFCEKHQQNAEDKKQLKVFLKFNINRMFKAKAALEKLQDDSGNKDLDILKKVFNAAQASGNAIFSELQKYT